MAQEAMIGEVVELCRYPVGSVGGEVCSQLSVTEDGVVGDRIFRVVRQGSISAIAGAHVYGFASLLEVRALYNDTDTNTSVTVILPDGTSFQTDDANAGELLSRYLGRKVELLPSRSSMVNSGGALAVPALPVAPLHIVSTASLAELAGYLGDSIITSGRFRPNVVVRTAEARGLTERTWVGRKLRIGNTTFTITENVRRCPMTSLAQPGVPRDPDIYKTILQKMGKEFGVYATPMTSSEIRTGDTVALVS